MNFLVFPIVRPGLWERLTKNTIASFKICSCRHMLRISILDTTQDKWIYSASDWQTDDMINCKLSHIGHILSKSNLEKIILQGYRRAEGKRGKHKIRWLHGMDIANLNVNTMCKYSFPAYTEQEWLHNFINRVRKECIIIMVFVCMYVCFICLKTKEWCCWSGSL